MADTDDTAVPFLEYLNMRFAEVHRAADLAKEVPPPESVPLREYLDMRFAELYRGMITAEQEREKAAVALRDELARQIASGDQALRDHIILQIEQLRLLILNVEEQSKLRIEGVNARVDASANVAEQHVSQLRREREIVTGAQTEAISKAEAATERRLEALNELRAMVTDAQQQFMPREVAEAKFTEVLRTITELMEKVNRLV